jgi:hypothetical protein
MLVVLGDVVGGFTVVKSVEDCVLAGLEVLYFQRSV